MHKDQFSLGLNWIGDFPNPQHDHVFYETDCLVRFDNNFTGEVFGLISKSRPIRSFAISCSPTNQKFIWKCPTYGVAYCNFDVNLKKFSNQGFANIKLRSKSEGEKYFPVLHVHQSTGESLVLNLFEYFCPTIGPSNERLGPLMFLKIERLEQAGVDIWQSFAPDAPPSSFEPVPGFPQPTDDFFH